MYIEKKVEEKFEYPQRQSSGSILRRSAAAQLDTSVFDTNYYVDANLDRAANEIRLKKYQNKLA